MSPAKKRTVTKAQPEPVQVEEKDEVGGPKTDDGGRPVTDDGGRILNEDTPAPSEVESKAEKDKDS